MSRTPGTILPLAIEENLAARLVRLAAALAFAIPAAATTTLDPSFQPVLAAPASVTGAAAMPNGQTVVIGNFTTMNGAPVRGVARLNADGTVDTSLQVDADISLDRIDAVAVQADGRILLGGQLTRYGATASQRYLFRLNADGSRDGSFDAGGFVYATTTAYGLDDIVRAIAIDAQGRILVGGDFTVPRTRVARLLASGAADAAFDPGTGADAPVTHIALQSTGHIVIGGAFLMVNGTWKANIARLQASGALDATAFGIGVSMGHVLAMTVQPDDRILIGGNFGEANGTPAALIARFDANGVLEAGFAPVGVANLQVVTSLAATADRILVGGWYTFTIFNGSPLDHDARVYVLQQSDGAWVNAVSFAGKPTDTLAFAKRPDGSVVVTGSFTRRDEPGDQSLVHGIGLLTGASMAMHATWRPVAGAQAQIRSLALQPDGKIIAGGSFHLAQGVPRNGVARLNPDGTIDATLDTPAVAGGAVTGVVVRGDGKLVMGGSFYNVAGNDFKDVALLSANGAYEAGAYVGSVSALAAYPGGKLVTVMPHSPGVARLDAAFALESTATFNPGTGISNSQQPDFEFDRVNAVAVQDDDRIVLAGSFSTFNGLARTNIVRLNADGSLDGTFTPPAFTVFNFRHEIFAVALQADGKIVIAGRFSTVGGLARPTVARLNADGSVDAGFVTPFMDQGSSAHALAIQPDGRIVVGGSIQVLYGSTVQNNLVRLNSDGSRDSTFPTSVTGEVRALLVAPANPGTGQQLLAGGSLVSADGLARPGLARYITPIASRRGDANGDGKADLFWRAGAGLSWWTMDGAAITGANYFEVDSSWQIAEVGDLDGDARADLVWRRASDGATYLWTLNGLAPAGFADLGIVPAADWTLVGVADFNGDGRSDMLWRRNADGYLYVWLMNGGIIAAQGSPGTVDLSWQVVDLADMDGDGRADLVWQRSADGATAVWLMNGVASTGGATIAMLDPATWMLVAAADFDGDGKADLLWRSITGETWVWLMDGAAYVSGGSIGNPGLSWTIRSVADLDGDGKADLVWRHADGTTYFWKMNGTTVSAYQPIANPGGSWQIVAP